MSNAVRQVLSDVFLFFEFNLSSGKFGFEVCCRDEVEDEHGIGLELPAGGFNQCEGGQELYISALGFG